MWILDELQKRKNDSDSIAIIHREKRETYKQLWDQSEKIAFWIDTHLKTKAPVLIYGDKDIEIVEIMIAALKTGRAYIPVDISFPQERVKQIANIAECEAIFDFSNRDFQLDNGIKWHVTQKELFNDLENNPIMDDLSEEKWVDGDENCYILFTSGSTGEPKGVQISKNNIVNFVNWFEKYAQIQGDVVLNQVSYSFDVSVIQLYIFMPQGKTLFCIDKGMISDFGVLFQYLKESDIAAWVSTPAFIEMCAIYDAFDNSLLPKLEKVILAGEVLTKKMVTTLWKKFSNLEVINGYGPTEGTVLLTCCKIDNAMVDNESDDLPIGRILDNAKYHIDKCVDANLPSTHSAVERGELVVSSPSISKGYFKNPTATKKCFFVQDGDKWLSYRTGDIVYERDGLLYFCGRKDFQIKLNGYRIELDDISENINRINGISNNVVLPKYKEGRVSYIAAFVVAGTCFSLSGAKATQYIRKELANLVPSYMIPKKIVILDQFPLNVNGKIDRKQLVETYL